MELFSDMRSHTIRAMANTIRILFLTIVAALCLTVAAAALQRRNAPPAYDYPPQLVNEMRQLQQAALKSDYAYRQVGYLCNNIGPRLSGSSQAEQAVKYVAEELRKLGLEVQLQKVMAPHWVRGIETGELVEFKGQATGTRQKVVLTALGGSVATPANGLTAPIVVVKDFDALT